MTVQALRPYPPIFLSRRLRDSMWSGLLTGAQLPPWLLRLGPTVFAVAVLAHVVTVFMWPPGHGMLIDLRVYQAGGEALSHGRPLYQHGVLGALWFTYPPIAAIIFTPLAPIPPPVASVLYALVTVALLVMATRACWRSLGLRPGADLLNLTLFSSGLLLWLEPVRTTLFLGQINVLLLALVLFDLLHRRRWQGAALGIAAGIKLTPLIFLPYLLLTRRFRAAAVAAGTFLGTILLGFLVTPHDSATFWLHGTFADATRVAQVDGGGNFSLHGLLARQLGLGSHTELLWLAGAVVLGAAGIAVAALAARRGHELFGVALTGLVGTTISPYSWGHHWVWFAPLVVFLLHRLAQQPKPPAWLALLTVYAATAAIITEAPSTPTGMPSVGLVSLHPPGLVGWLCHNAYVLLFLGTTVLGAAALFRPDSMQRRASLRTPQGMRAFGATLRGATMLVELAESDDESGVSPASGATDKDLWERAKDGSREAFGELFDRHAEAVWNHAYRLTASWALAEDITSNAFLIAWRRRSAITLIRDSALPWLYAVVGNLARTEHRRLARFRRALLRLPSTDPVLDHADRVAGQVDDDRRLRRVLDAVAQLPSAEREAVELCLLGELSTAEAAELLGVAEASMRSRISRARARLRGLVEEVTV